VVESVGLIVTYTREVTSVGRRKVFDADIVGRMQGVGKGGEGEEEMEQGRELGYRGTSLIRKSHPVGPYSRDMPRALWWS